MQRDKLESLIRYGTDEDRRLVAKLLDDPYYAFTPRPDSPLEFDEQESFVNSRFDGINCCIAGNASGKSYAAAWKCANFLRTTPPPVDLCKYFIASQTMGMVGALWQEKLSKFIPDCLIDDVIYWSSKENHPKTLIMKPSANGNRWMLCFRSYEQGRKSFQAISECAGYLLDEQLPTLSLLSEIDTRTREFTFPGSKMYVLTPLEPDEELQDRFEHRDRFPYWKFFRQNAERNFQHGGISNLQWLLNTPDDMRETRRIGDFAQFSGAIFKEFDENVHVVHPHAIPRHAEYFRSIDFGFSHDTAVLLLAQCDDVIYVVKEWGASQMMISEKVANIRREMPGELTTFADPEDAQQRNEFARLGMYTTIARKEPVTYGIELIRNRMSARKLVIFSQCKKLISQIKNYRWKEPKPNQETIFKERPIKRNDDYVDALRMGVHSLERSNLSGWEAAKLTVGQPQRV